MMAGYPAPPATPDHCDHVALYFRHRQLACTSKQWRQGQYFSDRAWRYEERSHHGLLIDREQIPARWPADAFIEPVALPREIAA